MKTALTSTADRVSSHCGREGVFRTIDLLFCDINHLSKKETDMTTHNHTVQMRWIKAMPLSPRMSR